MRVKLENPRILSEVIGIISELVTEVKLRFDSSGMKIIAIDPANVAMISFRLPKESFKEFDANNETLGINLDNFKAVLRRTKTSGTLIMHNKENVLEIDIMDKVKRNFSLALIEIESEDKEVPELEFLSQVQMNPQDLVDAIEDCLIVSDSCTFIASPNNFIVEAQGLNSARAEFSSDEVKLISGESKAKYSLEYLQKFIKASRIADKVYINFSTDHPVKLEFKNIDLDLSFILAPRVENED